LRTPAIYLRKGFAGVFGGGVPAHADPNLRQTSCVELGMCGALVKSLVVLQTLLLALPPGWCCAAASAESAPFVNEGRWCCQALGQEIESTGRPPDSHSPPRRPAAECCCPREATAPQKTAPPANDSALPVFAVAPVSVARLTELPAQSATGVWPGDPPLHVLQCEWLC